MSMPIAIDQQQKQVIEALICRPRPYQTPAGYHDEPYLYVFDTSNLPDGANYLNLSQPMMGDADFLLRKVEGMDSVLAGFPGAPGSWHLKDATSNYISQNPIVVNPGVVIGPPITNGRSSWAVVPEKRYPFNGEISFDLYNTLRFVEVSPPLAVPSAQAIFWGVKRFPGPVPMVPGQYQGPYSARPFLMVGQIILSWAGLGGAPPGVKLNNPRRFSWPVNNYDFELHAIHGYIATVPGPPPSDMALVLFDASGRAKMNNPVPIAYLSEDVYPGSAFSPPILYPAGSRIEVEVYSLIAAPAIPETWQIVFVGQYRIPVSKAAL